MLAFFFYAPKSHQNAKKTSYRIFRQWCTYDNFWRKVPGCLLNVAKFLLVLFKSLYWKKSFKLLSEKQEIETHKYTSDRTWKRLIIFESNTFVHFRQKDSRFFLNFLSAEYVCLFCLYFARIFFPEWPHSKQADCQYVDSISYPESKHKENSRIKRCYIDLFLSILSNQKKIVMLSVSAFAFKRAA